MGKAETKYRNTAQKMDSALLQLLNREDFDQITVTEVCREAGVNRSTFYAHYANTRELLFEVRDEAIRDFFSNFDHLSGNRDFLSREYLLAYLGFLESNSDVFRVILANSDLFDPDSIFLDFKDAYAEGVFSSSTARNPRNEYKLRFIVTGITSIVSTWLANGCRETKAFMADTIIECVKGSGSTST